MKKTIAVVGYGRFGRLAARALRSRFTVCVADEKPGIVTDAGITRMPIEEAVRLGIVLFALPINRLRSTLKRLGPSVPPGSLVVDVCSVKEEPVRWMKQYLPKGVDILGTHPLFGPDSAGVTIKNRSIVLCPVRLSNARLNHVVRTLKKHGLIVHRMTPRSHDRLMASTLFLTQFIGRGLQQLPPLKSTPSAESFLMLVQVARTAGNDSRELFEDMYRYNRFARAVPKHTIAGFQKLARSLAG